MIYTVLLICGFLLGYFSTMEYLQKTHRLRPVKPKWSEKTQAEIDMMPVLRQNAKDVHREIMEAQINGTYDETKLIEYYDFINRKS